MSRSTRRGGFTIFEVVISSSVLAVLVTLALGIMGSMSEHVADATVHSDLRARTHDASVLLQRELRSIARAHLVLDTPDPSSAFFTRLRYRNVIGFDTSTGKAIVDPPVGTAAHELRFLLDGGETSDGDDDDGDGLVDEGTVVLYRAGVRMADVATSVRASSFKLALSPANGASAGAGDTHLTVELTLQQRGRQQNITETYTEAVQVGLRN